PGPSPPGARPPPPTPLPARGERECQSSRREPLAPLAGRGRGPSRQRWEGEGQAEWAEPAALLRAGLYWPRHALPSLDDITREWYGDAGVAPIVFYRALVQSGNTAPVD